MEGDRGGDTADRASSGGRQPYSPVPESVVSAAKQAFASNERRSAAVAWLQEGQSEGSVRTFRGDGVVMTVHVQRDSTSSRIGVSVEPPSAGQVELECAGPMLIGRADCNGMISFASVPFGPARVWVLASGPSGSAWARSEWFIA